MIVIGAFTNKIRPAFQLQLSASGGVAPYSWVVDSGGAGGSISSGGLYTAPNTPGVDVITVTDANLDSENFSVYVQHPIQLFADIIRTEMDLDADQVYLYNTKLTLPPDSRMYVAIGVFYQRAFGSSNSLDGSGAGLEEVKSVNMMAALKVNIMSRSTDALFRKEEIALALQSNYSQRQQAKNAFKVADLPEQFQDLSEIDGSAIPYRFETTVKIQYAEIKRKEIEYYDDFSDVEITTEA